MKEKRLEQTDADSLDDDEEPTKRPRTRFVELQPGGDDPADAIDDEIPGVRLDVEPLVLAGAPFNPYPSGDPALSKAHLARDPGWARAQRRLLRMQDQDEHALEAVVQGEEGYDQPEEPVNEAGDTIEPFHLNKEREEGYLDSEGNYLEYDRPEDRDAWLDSIEDQVEGTKGDASTKLPYPNEPVVDNPAPLGQGDLHRYRQKLVELLQPGETVAAALRRLAGAGQVLDKFGSKGEATKAWRERMHSGRTVAPGNQHLFNLVTEAAEVLFDQGATDIYSMSREGIEAQLAEQAQQEAAPAEAAPPPGAVAEVPAALEGPAAASGTRGAKRRRSGGAGEVEAGVGGEQGGAGEEVGLDTSAGAPRSAHAAGRGASRGERQLAAAAAALPPEGGMPSVPGTEREPRGPAQEGALLGFAAQVPSDLAQELPVSVPPPQEVEVGLGVPAASPTAVEYQQKVAELLGDAGDELGKYAATPAPGAEATNEAGSGRVGKEGTVLQRSSSREH